VLLNVSNKTPIIEYVDHRFGKRCCFQLKTFGCVVHNTFCQVDFDLITVQRKLKDAGRFVYIDRVKKNPGFLQYIPSSLGYVKTALERLDEYRPLYETLGKYIPEWQ